MRMTWLLIIAMAICSFSAAPALAYHDPGDCDEYGRCWHYCNDPDYRDCKGDGNWNNPEEGEHFCHNEAACQSEPPFVDQEESNRRRRGEGKKGQNHGSRSAPCRKGDRSCYHGDP
jgi:hypothetical protein